MLEETAFRLANKAIKNPSLLNQLTQDTYETFVLGVAIFHKDLAMKLDDIKPIVKPQNKVKFWEAVGILIKEKDYS